MKKLLATLLALMMLAMPLSGLAELTEGAYIGDALQAGRRVNYSFSLSDVATDITGEPAVDQVLYDVLSGIGVNAYTQGDELYYAVTMKQSNGTVADLMTLGYALSDGDAYILSNLIGGTIVVNKDEVVPLLQRLVDMLVLLGLFTEDQAEDIKAEIPEMWDMLQQEFVAAMSPANAIGELNPEELNYASLLEIVTLVADKTVISESTMQAKNSDPAASMMTVTLTPAEMNNILACVLQFVRDNPVLMDYIEVQIAYETESIVSGQTNDFDGELAKAIDQLKGEQIFADDVHCIIWLDEEDMPVAAMADIPVADGEETINLSLSYARLTQGEAVNHSAVMLVPGGDMTLNVTTEGAKTLIGFDVNEEGENRIHATLEVIDQSTDENHLATLATLDMTITEVTTNVGLTYMYVQDGEMHTEEGESSQTEETINVKMTIASETEFSGVDFTEMDRFTVAVDGKEYFTFNVSCATSEPGASIMDGEVVRPASLDDNAFAQWFVGAYTAAYGWLTNVLTALPASVMNLMNTGF